MTLARCLLISALTSALNAALATGPATLHAASFPEFADPNPAPGNHFGAIVVPLPTGNVVVTSPGDDAGGANAGAVYLFNGATGALISMLRGSHADDALGGSKVMAVANGNFVVVSPSWDAGAATDVGAVTWGSGVTGVSGVVSVSNSLVGSKSGDQVGSGGVTVLANGNYVVRSPNWTNGTTTLAGAVTWCDGTVGSVGSVSVSNSLVGVAASDQVGSGGVTALTNGNYVVASPLWNNGAVADAGAATWGDGLVGRVGGISGANSLVGTTVSDVVGSGGVTALANGNYVVMSPLWNNGAVADVGAVTWGEGTSGRSGAVSIANSLVGAAASDQVGSGGVTALVNGNYVVASPLWNNGAIVDAGAATFGNGSAGRVGGISSANSLVGTTVGDQVGSDGVTALANGDYVVKSRLWDNGAAADAGAVTWGEGTGGRSGTLTAANSLVGSTTSDQVGSGGVTALNNGNYVVVSPLWKRGAVGDAGAATWVDGAAGLTGAVSVANSLVGSTAGDQVGSDGVTALANGNYVVRSGFWSNGAVTGAGAVTWGDGTIGVSGTITTVNSLVGSTANDRVGFPGVTALTNGNYVVQSGAWDGTIVDAGAVTWGNGTTGVAGVITASNSLVGSTANDQVGQYVTALSDGNYVVSSPAWDLGALADAGAMTWGNGNSGVTGTIAADSSIVGGAVNTGLMPAVEDAVNHTFIGSFTSEGGGHVRVGPLVPFRITSAVDIPGDQGGWLRLTFPRHYLDHALGSPPISTYGVWRHLPGTMPADLRTPPASASPGPAAIQRVRSLLPTGLEPLDAPGRLLVTLSDSRLAESAAVMPAGMWELVASVPALQLDQYLVAVPTITNAAPNDFVVTAHTTTPSIWFVTAPISGQSIDNLAPAQPVQFTGTYANGETDLHWAANSESDLGAYALYRGSSAGFVPSPGNRIALQIGTSYADVGPAGSYYKLAALDVNGNESSFALVTPQQTADVDGARPVAFAIHGIHPNPASGRDLRVAFALPSGEPARLELLDVSGRLLLARDVGALGAGQHEVNLAEGRGVRTGIYWVRLTQGRNRGTTRTAVIE